MTIGGQLNIVNNSTTGNVQVLLSNINTATTTITGNATITNSSTGASLSRIYLGNRGDVVFNGNLTMQNSSDATNSEVCLNYNTTSSVQYNGDIELECTNSSCDGFLFGSSGGEGELASGKSITTGSGGFIAGQLYFRNFTQNGSSTSINLNLTGTARYYSYNSNWDAPVTVTAPYVYFRDNIFNTTTSFDKTGSSNISMPGGNIFKGNSTIINSGAGYLRLGDGTADTFLLDATFRNTGGADFHVARRGSGHLFRGDVKFYNQGTNGNMYVADQSSASVFFNGSVSVTNSGGGTNHRFYLGNSGTVSFNGTVEISNTSTATHSEVYLVNSGTGTFRGNITLSNSSASTGIYFGHNNGSSSVVSTAALSVSSFAGGSLYFKNFDYQNTTALSLSLSSAELYCYNSQWAGNISFTATRLIISGTTFNGTAYLEKTGSSNDNSAGGNTFNGNVTFANSGSGYLYLGSGTSSNFLADVTLNNTGTSDMAFARSGSGHSVGGNLTINNTGTGSRVYISYYSSASLTVSGKTTVVNSGGGTNHQVYLSNAGDITFNDDVDISNSSNATNSAVYIGNNTSESNLIFNGDSMSKIPTPLPTASMFCRSRQLLQQGKPLISNREALSHDICI